MPALAAPARRYSILVTRTDLELDRGTWHTVTARSLGDALRGLRSGGLLQAAQVGYEPAQARVSAIECLGFAGR